MQRFRVIRNVQLGVKNLLLHKLRSLLTILGVVFGVGSVIAMLSVGEGASRQAMEQIRKLGSNNIIIESIKPTEDETAGSTEMSFLSVYGLLYEDERRILESIPAVVRTVPVKDVRKDGRAGALAFEMRIVGTTPEWFELVQRPLVAGRVLTWQDLASFNPVCVLTEHGVRRLLAGQYTVGESVRLGDSYYTVVGIVRNEQSTGSIQVPDSEVDAYVPMNVARERYGDISVRGSSGSMTREQKELQQILVQVRSTEEVEPAAAAVETVLRHFHKKQDYRLIVPRALLEQAEQTKRTFSIVLGSIAGISLLVGGIGIMNIMLASVTERTREIGIRRAIGARRRQIVMQFLIETMVLSSIGGLLGAALGVAFPLLITWGFGMPTAITPESIILSLAISVGVGVVFGLYPAMRAAKLDPIVALRHE